MMDYHRPRMCSLTTGQRRSPQEPLIPSLEPSPAPCATTRTPPNVIGHIQPPSIDHH